MIISPDLKRTFNQECRRRGVHPQRALAEAISNWVVRGFDRDIESSSGPATERHARRRTRMLSPAMVTAIRLKAADITQKEIARHIDLSSAQLCQWVNGSAVPSNERAEQVLNKLCLLVGVARDAAVVECNEAWATDPCMKDAA
jgi:DNA-binding transcriptional regulator YiaG